MRKLVILLVAVLLGSFVTSFASSANVNPMEDPVYSEVVSVMDMATADAFVLEDASLEIRFEQPAYYVDISSITCETQWVATVTESRLIYSNSAICGGIVNYENFDEQTTTVLLTLQYRPGDNKRRQS